MKFVKRVLQVDLASVDATLAEMSDIDLLNTIQNLTEEITLSWCHGIPKYEPGKSDIDFAKADLVAAMTCELKNRMELKDGELDLFYRLVTASTKKIIAGILTQRYRSETDRKEWALVSKASTGGKRKILYWFGTEKPSEVKKGDVLAFLAKTKAAAGVRIKSSESLTQKDSLNIPIKQSCRKAK